MKKILVTASDVKTYFKVRAVGFILAGIIIAISSAYRFFKVTSVWDASFLMGGIIFIISGIYIYNKYR